MKTFVTLSLLGTTKEDILKNIGNQTTLEPIDLVQLGDNFRCMDYTETFLKISSLCSTESQISMWLS